MRRRMAAVLGALAVSAAALVLSSTPASAAGTLTPWSSTAAVGAMFSVTVGGCPVIEEEHEDGVTTQQPVLVLTTTTGPLAESLSAGERLQFSATYDDEQARSGVMGIYTAYVWEGGGPAEPGPGGAEAIPGTPNYTG